MDQTDLSYRWTILLVLTVTQIGASLAALSFGPLAPFLQDSLRISRAQVGLLTSSLYFGSILVSIPTGRLADRLGVRRLLLVGPAFMAFFFFAFSRIDTYQTAWILALFAGMGYGVINPATAKAIMYWFSARGRATAIGIKQSGVTIGAAIAAALLPTLALALTWRESFFIIGAAVLGSATLCYLFYREFPGAALSEKGAHRADGGLTQVLTNRNIILFSFVDCVWSSIQMSVSTYLVLYLKETLLYSVVLAGVYLAMAQMSAGLGRVFWGVISDQLFQSRRKIVLLIIGVITTVTTLGMTVLTKNTPGWLIFVIVVCMGLSVLGRHGVLITFVAELAGRELAGTAMGVSITITYIGIIIGPPVFGHIVDITGSYALSWLIFGIASALATGTLLLVQEKRRPL
jgi:MFS transporter, ACS family, hexuronate transporter